ncbi:MAG: hypothetical protein A2W26_03575 [Acidobacteria bacterium RBG_16_64_8]|nr:MAG: hypothetical protein A2W26_03575 [Acidobacteria bacterium RBG_16_64_8]
MSAPSFSSRPGLTDTLRRLVQLSIKHPDLELAVMLQAGRLQVGIPKGPQGNEFEAALREMGTINQPLTDETVQMAATMTDGSFMRVVAPMARNAAGKYEAVVAVIYNPAGDPVELLLAGTGRQVPTAEWEPMQDT